MSEAFFGALFSLSLPLEFIGLFLALSDLRRWAWLDRCEQKLSSFSERRKVILGGLSLGWPGVELVALLIIFFCWFFFDVRFQVSAYVWVYGVALLLLFSLPFVCHAMKLFGKQSAVGSIGILIAFLGLLIELMQKIIY